MQKTYPARYHVLLCVVLAYFIFGVSIPHTEAQSVMLHSAGDSAHVTAGQPPDGGAFGSLSFPPAPPMSQEHRLKVEAHIAKNLTRLRDTGVLPPAAANAQVLFSWPLRTASNFTDPGYAAISAFVDHNSAYPNLLLDYNGGARTYDTAAGYNHQGTDIFPYPFGWNKMEQNAVYVIAAANGVITASHDGANDHNCSMQSSSDANYVVLTHSSGAQSWYWHLKKGSVTTKAIGTSVSTGEVLGVVGSSGISTGPHLHFEVRDATNNMIDPFAGAYNPTTADSWWQSQRLYYDSGINKITTGDAAPEVPNCSIAYPHETSLIHTGSRLYVTTYYRERLVSQQAQYALVQPDGSVFSSWTGNAETFYLASYWYWYWDIASSAPVGTWRFRSTLNGESYEKEFQVCTTGGSPEAPSLTSPRTNAHIGRRVTLDWGDVSCASTYNLIVRIDSRKGSIKIRGQNLALSQYTTKTLVRHHKYYWQVSACDSGVCRKSSWRSFSVR